MKHDARSLEGGSSESGSSETFTTEAASLEVIPDNPSDTPRTFTDIASSMDVLPLSRGSQPAKNDKRAKISVRDLYFHEEALAQGLIWHQVLSPPRSKSRRTRL